MLPERSKRYASPDGEVSRLTLASAWQLVLMALLVLTLLVLIFPHKALVDSLYQHQQLDELTLSYVQNLYRTEPDNADVALLLARTQRDALKLPQLQDTLWRLVQHGSPRQQREARQLLRSTYTQKLAQAPGQDQRAEARDQLLELLRLVSRDVLSSTEAQALAELAFDLNQPELGLLFFEQLPLEQTAARWEQIGDLTLGRGQYILAAKYFMKARERADTQVQARRLFQKGIRTLMQASLFGPALQAAQQHVGDLAQDRETLRFLVRTAQAAGQPALAARYARQLVFVVEPTGHP